MVAPTHAERDLCGSDLSENEDEFLERQTGSIPRRDRRSYSDLGLASDLWDLGAAI